MQFAQIRNNFLYQNCSYRICSIVGVHCGIHATNHILSHTRSLAWDFSKRSEIQYDRKYVLFTKNFEHAVILSIEKDCYKINYRIWIN